MSVDFEAEGLLEGVEGDAREARKQLLAELCDDGATLEELREAVEEDRLALLPVERLMAGEGPLYSGAEIAREAGVDADFVAGQRGALGLPVGRGDVDAKLYTEGDLQAAKRLRRLLDAGLPEEGIVEATRVVGLAMSQIAAASNALIGASVMRPGDTELDASRRYVAAAEGLGPLLGPTLEHALNLHILEALRSVAIGQAELAAGAGPGAQQITACFADLVGFTRLGEELPAEELGQVSGRLAALARDVAQSPVRLVKMIGDAAMLVSTSPEDAIEATLALVEAAEAEGESFPALRAGVASGPALSRAGDWYGRPVNLASRLTAIARPGSVLASEDARDLAPEAFSYSFAGERSLRGVSGKVKLFRVRRVDGDGA
jgi:adenylate cyclase